MMIGWLFIAFLLGIVTTTAFMVFLNPDEMRDQLYRMKELMTEADEMREAMKENVEKLEQGKKDLDAERDKFRAYSEVVKKEMGEGVCVSCRKSIT